MARLKKGSAAAKAWGAKMRALRGKGKRKSLKTSSYSRVSRGIKKMARRRYSRARTRRRRGGMTIPLAPVLGLAAGLIQPAQRAMAGDYTGAFNIAVHSYTGYNPASQKFDVGGLWMGLAPLLAGLLVHKFVGGSPLNLNATLARARVPFIRI